MPQLQAPLLRSSSAFSRRPDLELEMLPGLLEHGMAWQDWYRRQWRFEVLTFAPIPLSPFDLDVLADTSIVEGLHEKESGPV